MYKFKTLTSALILIVCGIFGGDTIPWHIIGAVGAVLGLWGLVGMFENYKRTEEDEKRF